MPDTLPEPKMPEPVGEHDHPEHAWAWTALELRWIATRDAQWRTYAAEAVRQAVEEERHECAMVVWMTLQRAIEPDADDLGLAGWLRFAEDAIRSRSQP